MAASFHLTAWARLAASVYLYGLLVAAHATVEFTPCELEGSTGYSRTPALCGTFTVPENPAEPDGRQIDLFVAKIASLSPTPQTDAVTLINGGPGASSVSLYVDLAGALRRVLPERDIIVVDQRGTGRSNPLTCPDLEEVSQTYHESAVTEATLRCLAALTSDPRFYSTSQAVDDLDALRTTLGYRALNIYGVSYGTRVALHYLRQYPERVRAIVIDGAVPPDLALGVNVAQNAQTALDRTLERCSTDATCTESFSNLEESLNSMKQQLGARTIPLQLPHPLTGADTDMEFGYQHLAISLRLLSYAPETTALIPLIISETSNGNYTPSASMALRFIDQLAGDLSFGMHNAVVCTEDLPFLDEASIDWPRLEATYLGADQVRALITICKNWPAAAIDEGFKLPVTSAVPALVLSGERDPVTPPEYGTAVAKHLSNSVHIIAPGQGHGVISRGCIPGLVADFISTPDPALLDATCAERLTDSPFFLNVLGPAP